MVPALRTNIIVVVKNKRGGGGAFLHQKLLLDQIIDCDEFKEDQTRKRESLESDGRTPVWFQLLKRQDVQPGGPV